jgi:hypothetical protein
MSTSNETLLRGSRKINELGLLRRETLQKGKLEHIIMRLYSSKAFPLLVLYLLEYKTPQT